MHRFWKWLILLLTLILISAAGLLFLALQENPQVQDPRELSHHDIARVKAILARNDPRRLQPGQRHTVRLDETELDMVTGYLAERSGRAQARARLQGAAMQLEASVAVPTNPFGAYLNLFVSIDTAGNALRFKTVRIGDLPIPAPLVDALFEQLVVVLLQVDEYRLLIEAFDSLQVQGGVVDLTLVWNEAIVASVRDHLITAAERSRIVAYHRFLAEYASRNDLPAIITVSDLLSVMFGHAIERSSVGHAVDENRAMLLVLAAYMDGRDLSVFVPALRNEATPVEHKIMLLRRHDFGKHFLISAALAAVGDRRVANAVGLFKEISDFSRRSGFSFTDLAADKAGTRFGELATASETAARFVQAKMAVRAEESDYMPAVHGLPEFVDYQQFERRFQSIGSSTYNRVIDDIDDRVEACLLYREALELPDG